MPELSAIIHRITPGDGKTLYLRRIVGPCCLWHPDRELAQRFDPAAADRLAGILRQRSIGKKGQPVTEPPGSEYGVDHA